MTNTKTEMKSRARITRGLINLLRDDMDYITEDIEKYDIVNLAKSIEEARANILELDGHLSELEYLTYVSKRGNSRNLHSL